MFRLRSLALGALVITAAAAAVLIPSPPGTVHSSDDAVSSNDPGAFLLPGFNNLAYLGPPGRVEYLLTNAADAVTAVWHYDPRAQPSWKLWSAALPRVLRGFSDLAYGEAYFVVSRATTFWRFSDWLPLEPGHVRLRTGLNHIVYSGQRSTIARALAHYEPLAGAPPPGALSYITRVWAFDTEWRLWDPALPLAVQGLRSLRPDTAYFVNASVPCILRFPGAVSLPANVPSFDAGALLHGGEGHEGAILRGPGIVPNLGLTNWELIFPSAHFRAAMIGVGVTPAGLFGAPDNPHVIGWWSEGPAPGEPGNVLLDGHRDFTATDGTIGTGVCWQLDDAGPGDLMIIRDRWDGRAFVYTVRAIHHIAWNDPAGQSFLRSGTAPTLTLITCEGSFDQSTHNYSQRTIVVADLTDAVSAARPASDS